VVCILSPEPCVDRAVRKECIGRGLKCLGGPADRTNKDRELHEVVFTEAAKDQAVHNLAVADPNPIPAT
jgi:hypothetical protein